MYQVRGQAQTVINDLARIVLGVTRADHYKVEDLLDRAGLPSINEIVVRQSALASWKASQGGALQDLLQPYDDRTRGSSSNLKKPIS